MTRKCSKKAIALVWTLLECMFFSSVVLGWTWMSIVLRMDGYFPEYCNRSAYRNQSAGYPLFGMTAATVIPEPPSSAQRKVDAPGNKPCRQYREYSNRTVKCRQSLQGSLGHTSTKDDSQSYHTEWINIADSHTLERFKRRQPTTMTSRTTTVTTATNDNSDVIQDDQAMGYCREKLRIMFALVVIIRDLLTFPLGYIFDKYGTTRTRLLTVLIFVLGTLMMTFTSSSVPWLVVPALALTGVAGSAVLLTNLQTANLFGRKRHVVVSLYVGAAYSNSVIAWLMQLSHFAGVNVQTSFMFLTIGIVPMLVSTVAFLPKTRIPWPLPADYGKRRNQSLDEALIRKQRAWQRRMSEDLDPDLDPQLLPDSSHLTDYDSTEAGAVRCRRPPPKFMPTAVQPLFVWSLLWFGLHRLQEAVFETNVVQMADLEIMGPLDYETYFGIVQLLGVVCSPLVGVLIDRHFPRELGTTAATQQMQRIVPAIMSTSALAVSEIVIDMFPGAAPKAISTLFNILHKVFTHTTMCAFVMHVHYNHQHLGKFYGLTCAVSAVIAAFQFPIWKFLLQKYSSMLPVHILLLLLSILTFAHGVSVWEHCRRRLICDHSDQSSERGGLTSQNHQPLSFHIETDSSNLPVSKETIKVVFTDDSAVKQHPQSGSMELSPVTSSAQSRNGGVHIVFEKPDDEADDAGTKDRYDDPEADLEDEEEEGEINVMDFISL